MAEFDPFTLQDPIEGEEQAPPQPDPFEPTKLLAIFDRCKRESMENRWMLEREWLRDLNYVAGRQWIVYHPSRREWVDKRLQKWIPRPITNKMAETLQAIRTNFAAINLAVKARPVGNSTAAISAAEVADQMAPLIHEENNMDQVMRESDFWLITTGTSILQASWSRDQRANRKFVAFEQCTTCGTTSRPEDIKQAGDRCPVCGQNAFMPAIDPMTGEPAGEWIAFGKGKTTALSPFEWAVPPNITRFDDLPYIIRLRWRDKHWFEANRPDLISKISWEQSPSERSLQIYKALAQASDVSSGSTMGSLTSSSHSLGDGVTEYELWMKPTPEYPEGLVMRVIGDSNPILLDLPEEGLPGPFPYKDIEGKAIFPFAFAQYEQFGGKLHGRGALSPLIQKQDQLNQLDSLIQLIVQRMANPIWLVPESAGVEHFTGEPGLVMKWNPLAAGGNAKPERVAGVEVPQSLQNLRAQILSDMEALSGAFDIIKGQKPAGVEAFSALQLLVERSQSRFTNVFQARGEMYRRWFSIAIEMERSFGPEERVWAVVGPNRGYTFQHFENAQLQGAITFQLEDGSNMPKTALGKRAAIEQANQLQLLNPQDPDQKYALLTTFGLSDLVPSLNYHVQTCIQMQDKFERWVSNPQGPPPLVYKPWFDPMIHWSERIKWLNTDRMRDLMMQYPWAEQIITQHLAAINFVLNPPIGAEEGGEGGGGDESGSPKPQGGALAARNSNQNSGSTQSMPSGNEEEGPNVGPA